MFRWRIAAAAGLGVAVLVTAVAMIVEAGRIERDVAARAEEALAGEATSWASIAVHGRDLTLAGAAPSEELRAYAATRLARVFGVRGVDATAASLLPEQSAYRVVLEREGDTLRVGGFAPSDPDRRRMLARISAALPDLAAEDRLALARGMPGPEFLAALAAVTPVVADLSAGTVEVEAGVVRIRGTAATNETFQALAGFAPPLPAGYVLESFEIARPLASPYTLSAALEDGRVEVSGHAPDALTRARILAVVEEGARSVEETVDLASGEPAGFGPAAIGAVDFLDLFAEVRIDLVDDRISFSGIAASPEAYRTLTSHLAAFAPAGFTVSADVRLPVVSPYTLSATRSGGKLTITGFAPDPQAADDIRRAADLVAAPGGSVVETSLAAGAPERYREAAAFAVRLLEHVSEGSVVIADGRITLAGTAATSSALLEIEASVALETPEGFEVESTVQPPMVSPYVWAIERTEDSVILSGHVPSEAVRLAVREAAEDAIGDLAVTDRTGLAAGLPAGVDLAAVAAFAAAEVALLDEGRVELVDSTLSVRGRTADALAGRSAIDAFETRLPAGVRPGGIDIEVPVTFDFRVERAPGAVIVEGDAPDEAARARLADLADRLFAGADLQVALTVEEGLPEGSANAAEVMLRAAALLRRGTVTAENRFVDIDGMPLLGSLMERLDTDLVAELPPGFGAVTRLEPPAEPQPVGADVCRARLAGAADHVRVLFESGPAGAIAPESEGAVAELAAAALGCRDVRLVVEVGPGGDLPAAEARRRAGALAGALRAAGVAVPVEGRAGGPPGDLAVRVETPAAPAPAAPVLPDLDSLEPPPPDLGPMPDLSLPDPQPPPETP